MLFWSAKITAERAEIILIRAVIEHGEADLRKMIIHAATSLKQTDLPFEQRRDKLSVIAKRAAAECTQHQHGIAMVCRTQQHSMDPL